MKSKKMKIVAAVMVLSMLTTCMISGTLAKYTTGDSAMDSARVAKWGVEVQAAGYLYGNTYGSDNQVVASNTLDAFSVSASATPTENVVAPGTNTENGFKFSVTGKPEVSGSVIAKVSYENIYLTSGKYGIMKRVTGVTEDNFAEYDSLYYLEGGKYKSASAYGDSVDKMFFTLEDYVELGETYYPVEYKMTGTSKKYNIDFSEANNVDSLNKLIKVFEENFPTDTSSEVIDGGKTTKTWKINFDANQDLKNILSLQDQNISWKWDFCQAETECSTGDTACEFCKADSILANLMQGESLKGKVVKSIDGISFTEVVAANGAELNDYNLETQFDINITVTQTD